MTADTEDPSTAEAVTLRRSESAEVADLIDVGEFERFFAEHRTAMVALVYSLAGTRQAAEDVAQEAFAEAFRRWETISRYDNPGAWVRRVAMNKAVSGVRRRANETKALLRLAGQRQPPGPSAEPTDSEFWAAVRNLPTRQAQAVALHYLEDRSVADIARILDRAEPTVRVHLHRGRMALARTLGLDREENR